MLDMDKNDLVQAALGTVATYCDHAKTTDAVGFSQAHSFMGHHLATYPLPLWDTSVALSAWQLTGTYFKQIAKLGNFNSEQLDYFRSARELSSSGLKKEDVGHLFTSAHSQADGGLLILAAHKPLRVALQYLASLPDLAEHIERHEKNPEAFVCIGPARDLVYKMCCALYLPETFYQCSDDYGLPEVIRDEYDPAEMGTVIGGLVERYHQGSLIDGKLFAVEKDAVGVYFDYAPHVKDQLAHKLRLLSENSSMHFQLQFHKVNATGTERNYYQIQMTPKPTQPQPALESAVQTASLILRSAVGEVCFRNELSRDELSDVLRQQIATIHALRVDAVSTGKKHAPAEHLICDLRESDTRHPRMNTRAVAVLEFPYSSEIVAELNAIRQLGFNAVFHNADNHPQWQIECNGMTRSSDSDQLSHFLEKYGFTNAAPLFMADLSQRIGLKASLQRDSGSASYSPSNESVTVTSGSKQALSFDDDDDEDFLNDQVVIVRTPASHRPS